MSSKPLRRALPLVFALLAASGLAACREEKADKGGEPVRPVKTVTIAKGDETRPIRFSGSVRARVETALGFRVPGKIVDRKVDIGARVEAGRCSPPSIRPTSNWR